MTLMNLLKTLSRINLIKSIRFNLKVFPFKTALHLPVVFFGRCQVVVAGRVNLSTEPRFGILQVGENHSLTYGIRGSHSELTYFRLSGVLDLNGCNNIIANGCRIYIKKGGRLSLNGNTILQNRSKIHCAKRIVLGKFCCISWESQVFDTNMHYIIDAKGEVKNNKGTIIVGDYCWIGNRCVIQKGTVLPDYTVVASNSLVNKDFTSQPSGIIAGIPAKLIKIGSKRLFDFETERLLDKFFHENPTTPSVSLSDIL